MHKNVLASVKRFHCGSPQWLCTVSVCLQLPSNALRGSLLATLHTRLAKASQFKLLNGKLTANLPELINLLNAHQRQRTGCSAASASMLKPLERLHCLGFYEKFSYLATLTVFDRNVAILCYGGEKTCTLLTMYAPWPWTLTPECIQKARRWFHFDPERLPLRVRECNFSTHGREVMGPKTPLIEAAGEKHQGFDLFSISSMAHGHG